MDEQNYEINLCKPDCFKNGTFCIQKCCDIHKIMSLDLNISDAKLKCKIERNLPWRPNIYKKFHDTTPLENPKIYFTTMSSETKEKFKKNLRKYFQKFTQETCSGFEYVIDNLLINNF